MEPSSPIPPLTEDQLTAYRDNGFIIIRGLFKRSEMQSLKKQTVARVRERYPDNHDGVPVFFLDDVPKELLSFCCGPELTAIAHQLLGPRIEFLSVKPVYKNASITFPSAWHQDYAYWGGSNKLSVWIALDDATVENGCLRFLPGAHHSFIPHQVKDGTFGHYLKEDELDISKVVDAPMTAGDACFFIDLAPHASFGNVSGHDRWSIIPTYRNADSPDPSNIWRDSVVLKAGS